MGTSTICSTCTTGVKCSRRFKTQRNMRIHRAKCKYGYDTTEQYYELEDIIGVFGSKASDQVVLVQSQVGSGQWAGYPEPEWERENLLLRDGCQDETRDFWVRSGLKSNKQFYPEPDGKHRCTVCGHTYLHTYKRKQDLKTHQTRKKHIDTDKPATTVTTKTAVQDAKAEKRKQQQKSMPTVRWGDKEVQNCWRFPYLVSPFEAGGDNMSHVSRRIAMARARLDKLGHLWSDNNLHLNLKLRLYRSNVCSILTYGSEVWYLTTTTKRELNDTNSQMMSIITDKTQNQEASKKSQTFDLVKCIRARRLQWLDHTLRMDKEHMVKQAIFVMFKARSDGDMLMDAPHHATWRELCTYTCHKDFWRARVRGLRQSRVTIETGSHITEASTAPFTISYWSLCCYTPHAKSQGLPRRYCV